MFTHRLTLFKLFGFAVKVDASWLFLAVLVTWSLATAVFPEDTPGYSPTTYWIMGAGGALGLFLSIALHELGHSVVARRFGIEIRDITLFIFGGVADMKSEPSTAKGEFWMAIAGPITSMLIALGCQTVYMFARPDAGVVPALQVVHYLGFLNGILALFNLVPAFPLDGGRVLRAALWTWKEDYPWATRIASQIGSAFGLLMIVLGLVNFIGGDVIGGLWFFMIGMFIRGASAASYQRVVVNKALAGQPVRRFMKTNPVVVPPSTFISDFVQHYIYEHHYKMYPVTTNGRLLGCVTTRGVKTVPREDWNSKTVGEILTACGEENSITPDADAESALDVMTRTRNSRLMVVENGELRGLITLKDLLEFLALKTELEG